ncbi:MAG: hypothetical protein NC236_00635 [Mycoplasma sp.]|nr:hypothetical protein [Mycoplasma sp.]
MSNKEEILIVDGNSLLFKAYYATAYSGTENIMRSKDGIATNAIYLFNIMLSTIIQRDKPSHVMVAFDAAKKTRRHELLESYKGNRATTPEDLIPQFSMVREMLTLMKIKWYEVVGWEADDIIATLAKKSISSNIAVKILSTDKDLLQLVDENITVLANKRGVKTIEVYTSDNFYEKVGIAPNQVADYKGLVGDPSDNLPGVKGIGNKTAIKLLNKYDTLEGIYEKIDELTNSIKNKLETSKKMAFLCKKIATLKFDVEIPFKYDDLKFERYVSENLLKFYEKFNLNSLYKRDLEYIKSENSFFK